MKDSRSQSQPARSVPTSQPAQPMSGKSRPAARTRIVRKPVPNVPIAASAATTATAKDSTASDSTVTKDKQQTEPKPTESAIDTPGSPAQTPTQAPTQIKSSRLPHTDDTNNARGTHSARIARIPAVEIFPSVEDGLWAAKAVVGESFPVQATCFREGHDAFAAEAVLLDPAGKEVDRRAMYDIAPGLDRYETKLAAREPGMHTFHIETYSDPYATWVHDAAIKVNAGVDVELALEEGARLCERAAQGKAFANPAQLPPDNGTQQVLLNAARTLRDQSASAQARLSAGLHGDVRTAMRQHPLRDLLESSRSYPLWVDRERALYGSWYEIFPRSYGAYQNPDGSWVSGTLRAAANEVERISELGFDVLYLTPIHPIGTKFRKGRNNTLEAGPNDPGSPYGIGAATGGHDAIHPDLGDFTDFDYLVAQAQKAGMEVALDLALQCSPDHPWVQDHPEWFTTRADGTIAYAENPPKKYQDIYPLNFDNDPEGIYQAILACLELWVEHGVKIFRVDNPHTKPLNFWQRLLNHFRKHHPDVLFLAEAFTRPAMMRTLGAIGFQQSYTYFTWRTTKHELETYFKEVAYETAHLMRPAFWPTTHDILTPQMWSGGVPIFIARAVLAATGSPTWGIYSGYEMVENVPRPGFEEQIDNEKYEYRPRDWDQANPAVVHALQALNQARREHPALQRLRNIAIHETTHPNVICYSRHVDAWESPTGKADTVIVVVNLDPHNTACGIVNLDLQALGAQLPMRESGRPLMRVTDQLDGHSYEWGASNYFELNPNVRVAHVFSVNAL